MTDQRHAEKHANYNGDVTHAVGEVMGPNEFGERMTVVEAAYDPETNKTRLGFAYTTVGDLEAVK